MKDSLIREYHNQLPPDLCKNIIEWFEGEADLMEGVTSGGVKKNVKASTDFMIHNHIDNPNWRYVYDYIMENLLHNVVDYIKDNPYMIMTGDFSSTESLVSTAHSFFGVTGNHKPHLQMQRYVDNEGYYAWHYENEGGDTSDRELFFIYYLNSIEGGHTEFMFNQEKIKPEEGKLIVAPALWTHKHRGNSPGPNEVKYIITGWLEKKSNNLFQNFLEDYMI